MKLATYEVTLTFSEGVSEYYEHQLLLRLLDALVHESHTFGLVPDTCPAFTTTITVKGPGGFATKDVYDKM